MNRNAEYESVLNALDLQADPFSLCELEGKCTLGLGRIPQATLHYVLSGEGRIGLGAQTGHRVTPGWLLLVPACRWHVISSDAGNPAGLPSCAPAELQLDHHVARGDGQGGMRVLCASVSVSFKGAHGLIDLLQHPLALDLSETPGAAQAMALLQGELAAPKLGSRALIRALLLQCLIEMFRTRLIANDPALTWLRALGTPRLLAALHAMLHDPGAAHSVETLAETAGMSRSRFAEAFAASYRTGPMEFLRDLRMARAAQILLTEDTPVKRVAAQMGFRSRSAFSRSFAAQMGVSPQQFRANRAR